jgi:hypothetical protein
VYPEEESNRRMKKVTYQSVPQSASIKMTDNIVSRVLVTIDGVLIGQ